MWEAAGRKVRRDPDGRPSVQIVGFRLEFTFDVSQTDGEPFEVPTVQRLRRQRFSSAGVPQLLTGDDPTDAFDDVVKLIKDAGYNFELAAPGSRFLGAANGVTVGGDVMLVKVRDDVSTAQRLKTTIHDPLRTSAASTSPAPASGTTCTAAGGRPRPKASRTSCARPSVWTPPATATRMSWAGPTGTWPWSRRVRRTTAPTRVHPQPSAVGPSLNSTSMADEADFAGP